MATSNKDFHVKHGIYVSETTDTKDLTIRDTVVFTAEYNNSSSTIIDWRNGNRQKVLLENSLNTITFSHDPTGPSNLLLKVIQDENGQRAITSWDSSIDWGNLGIPYLSFLPNKYDLISFYFDGSTYHGQAATGYGP